MLPLCVLLCLGAAFKAPLGVHPSLYEKYKNAINEEDSTFKCFDGSKVIPLEQLNDNYPDCPDFSDEPGSGVNENSTFYCLNEHGTPLEIPSWSVGDGICDCCDGSDEFFNTHSNCKNTCLSNEEKRISVAKELSRLSQKYSKSIESYRKQGRALIKGASSEVAKIEKKIDQLRKKESALYQNQALGVKVPRAKRVFKSTFEEIFVTLWKMIFWVPRATILAEESRRGMRSEEINAKIREQESEKRKFEDISKWQEESDPALVPLFGREFRLDDFTLTFMREMRNGRESLGSFQSSDPLGYHHYKFGMRSQHTRVKVICGSANRLLDVQPTGDRAWEALFATTAACSRGSSFEDYTYEELRVIARGFGKIL